MFAVRSLSTVREVTMKRVKRNMTQRAYSLGYVQGLKGHAKERCPFETIRNGFKRGQWMAGWRIGHACYVAGYLMPQEALSG